MKMPHVDDHILRAPQSPHLDPRQSSSSQHNDEDRAPPRSYGKMPTETEVAPPRDGSSYPPPLPPAHHRWRQPAFNDLTHSTNVNSTSPNSHNSHRSNSGRRSSDTRMETPPVSPHTPVLRQDYASYEGPYHHPPRGPPVSHRGGYSYYHSRGPPPPMPMDSPPGRHPPHYLHQHHQHPDPMMSGPPPPPPPPPHYSTPARYSPSHYPPHYHHHPYADSQPSSSPPPSSGYYDYDYHANFIPPSASMTSATASLLTSPSEDEYNYYYQQPQEHPHHQEHRHRFEPMSPQSMTSSHPIGGSSSGCAEVSQVEENDVLCGRGAPTNYHQGNELFRELVKEYQGQYLASKRADKPHIATHIVNIIQSRGGRFLRRFKRSGTSSFGHFVWVEVDPQKAYEKACQALREGAPEIRRKMKSVSPTKEHNGEDDEGSNAAGVTTASTTNDESALTQQQGERMQEDDSTTQKTDGKNSEAALKPEANDDDRNDEMEDSEKRC